MPRGIAAIVLAMLALSAACGGGRPEVGDRVAVDGNASVWDPRRCGSPFPRVTRLPDAEVRRYMIDCPRTGEQWTDRVHVASVPEQLLGRIAWGFPYLATVVTLIAVGGLLLPMVWPRLRDPLGLAEAQRRLEAAHASRGAVDLGARLAALRCAQCGSAVPLVDGPVAPCHHCAAVVEVPADYRALARLRAESTRDHAAAARLWRHYQALVAVARSRLVMTAVTVLVIVQMLAAGYGLIVRIIGGELRPFVPATVLGGVLALGALWRLRLRPPTRLRDEWVLPADRTGEEAPCAVCGAPIEIPPPSFVLVGCLYCGTEHLLGSRIARKHATAVAARTHAAGSLLEATETMHRTLTAAARNVHRLAWVILGGATVLAGLLHLTT